MIEQITINKHSSIRIQGERIIYFDPYGIEEETHDADVIFVTHDHHDHFDPESINKIIRDDTLLIIPRSSMDAWSESGIIATQLVQMDPGQKIDLFGLLIETVPAYNNMKPFHPKRNEWLGYIVTTDDRRIYVAGDTDVTDEARAVKCDIAFVPVGGKYTMNAEKAAELINLIRPDIAVPTHYGSIVGKPGDGRVFKELVSDDIIVPLLIRHKVETAEPEVEEPAVEEAPVEEAAEYEEPEVEEAPVEDAAEYEEPVAEEASVEEAAEYEEPEVEEAPVEEAAEYEEPVAEEDVYEEMPDEVVEEIPFEEEIPAEEEFYEEVPEEGFEEETSIEEFEEETPIEEFEGEIYEEEEQY